MRQLYYLLNEYMKAYHVFCKFDTKKANEILGKINECRLQIVTLAEQREIFYSQIDVPANASGYKNDVFFTQDDINSLVIRMIAWLEENVTMSLTQLATREVLFTRQAVAWQQIASEVQDPATNTGQKIPFDFNQEIYLEANQALDIGITNQTTGGFVFLHGCNLKDDYAPNRQALLNEISLVETDGTPNLPKPQLVPIQFMFRAGAVDDPAVAVDGGKDIFSIKSERSIVLLEVSTTSINSRMSLSDRGRNQEMAVDVESLGVAGYEKNQYAVYYPLPYPHLLRAQDRLQFRALNGSNITGTYESADLIQTLCFRGFTI